MTSATMQIECPACAGQGGAGTYCEDCDNTGMVYVPECVGDELSGLRESVERAQARAEQAEAKLTAIPWMAIHRVHLAAQGMDLDDWITVADWTHNNMPRQEVQP